MTWKHALAFTFSIVLIKNFLRVSFGNFFYSGTGYTLVIVLSFGLPLLVGSRIFKQYRAAFFKRLPVAPGFAIKSILLVVLLCLFSLALGAIEEVIINGFQDIIPVGFSQRMTQHFFSILFVAPVIEELFFRGFLLLGLLQSNSRLKAISVTTFIFFLFHLPWTTVNGTDVFISGPLSAILFSSLLSWLMTIHNNVRISILLHFIWNLCCYVAPFVVAVIGLPLANPVVFSLFIGGIIVACAMIFINSTKKLIASNP